MRKLAIAVALSTTVLAGPALARDGAWYVGGDFGAMIVEDTDTEFTPGTAATNSGIINVGFDEGFDGSLFAGYDFGAFRIEAEVSYKNADVNELITSGVTPPGTTGTSATFLGGNGDVTILSGMINGMLDFGDDDGLSGFVGGGVGLAQVDFGGITAFTNTGVILDDSDTRFAWQIIAGVRQALSPNVDIHLKYRFFNVDDLEFQGFSGSPAAIGARDVSADLRTHSLLGGITFNFGRVVLPLECEAPNYLDANGVCTPPELPCPEGTMRNEATRECEAVVVPCPMGTVRDAATGACEEVVQPCPPNTTRNPSTGSCDAVRVEIPPAIVYFGWDRDDLTAEARSTLDGVAQNYRNGGQTQVVLAGHADRSGSATYNVGLSQRRNSAVQQYLEAAGVPGSAMTAQAFGEGRPAIETPDGVREPQNRRVEITFGPGSGW